MTTTTHTATDASRRIAHADDRAARALVTAGAIAGPVFVLTAGVQSVTPRRIRPHAATDQPALARRCRLGADHELHPRRACSCSASPSAPRAHCAAGRRAGGHRGSSASSASGSCIGGAFTADPALGFPAGAPEGIPETMSFHAMVHAIAPPLAFTALVIGDVRRRATALMGGPARRRGVDASRGGRVLRALGSGGSRLQRASLPGRRARLRVDHRLRRLVAPTTEHRVVALGIRIGTPSVRRCGCPACEQARIPRGRHCYVAGHRRLPPRSTSVSFGTPPVPSARSSDGHDIRRQ